MTKPTNSQVGMIVGVLAVLGVSLGGVIMASNNSETANNANVQSQTESVINLPATNQKVDSLVKSLNDEKEETEREFERFDQTITETINRRESELRQEIKEVVRNLEKQIDISATRIERLEQEIFDMVPHNSN